MVKLIQLREKLAELTEFEDELQELDAEFLDRTINVICKIERKLNEPNEQPTITAAVGGG
jgi:hypothetical protein